ncbi:MAG: hypothetical protein M3295_06880, partial [Chloroflexota bacterium]|nr:hypothetical protein [Chloroflexota bacterium]
FNTYFGTDLRLLPDRSYVFTDEAHFYDWIDITDVLHEKPGTDERPIPTPDPTADSPLCGSEGVAETGCPVPSMTDGGTALP